MNVLASSSCKTSHKPRLRSFQSHSAHFCPQLQAGWKSVPLSMFRVSVFSVRIVKIHPWGSVWYSGLRVGFLMWEILVQIPTWMWGSLGDLRPVATQPRLPRKSAVRLNYSIWSALSLVENGWLSDMWNKYKIRGDGSKGFSFHIVLYLCAPYCEKSALLSWEHIDFLLLFSSIPEQNSQLPSPNQLNPVFFYSASAFFKIFFSFLG